METLDLKLILFMAGLVAASITWVKTLPWFEAEGGRFLPGLAIVLGVAAMALWPGGEIHEDIISGVMVGLSACGLYENLKPRAANLPSPPGGP
jgi:hypothetical protein